MSKCRFWKKCNFYRKGAVTCDYDSGYYGFNGIGYVVCGCYETMEKKESLTEKVFFYLNKIVNYGIIITIILFIMYLVVLK